MARSPDFSMRGGHNTDELRIGTCIDQAGAAAWDDLSLRGLPRGLLIAVAWAMQGLAASCIRPHLTRSSDLIQPVT
jgi:hypothetical protein